jgi:glutamate 5-kinase
MASKLVAARMASWSGVTTVIAQADRVDVLADAVAVIPGVGTVFAPHARRLSARKLWIAFAVSPSGRITVDEGARLALVDGGRSLLAAGVRRVDGEFDEGDAVEIATDESGVFARGLASSSVDVVRSVAGRRTGDMPEGVPHEIVHRDDLVVLK